MTLNKIELVHPIFEMIFIGLSTSSFCQFELYKSNFPEILNTISWLIFTYIIYQILNISKRVELKKDQLIEGVYIIPIGFVKVSNQISIHNIVEIGINQNSKKYFKIFTKSKDVKIITIKTLPNKFPAESELEVIKNKIKTYKLHKRL